MGGKEGAGHLPGRPAVGLAPWGVRGGLDPRSEQRSLHSMSGSPLPAELAPPCGASGGGREGGATPPRYYLGHRGARREPRPERTRGGGFRPESAARQPCCDRRRAAVGIPGLGHFPGFPAVGVTKPNALPRGRPWAGRKGRGRCLGGFLLFLPRAWGKGRKVPPSSPVLATAEGSAWATSPSPQENPIKGSICPRAEGLRGFGHAPASKDMGVPAAPHPRPRLL